MAEYRSGSLGEQSRSFVQDQRQALELELIKTRNEAAAAKLEARAAEIELMLRQICLHGGAMVEATAPTEKERKRRSVDSASLPAIAQQPARRLGHLQAEPEPAETPFSSWGDLRDVLHSAAAELEATIPSSATHESKHQTLPRSKAENAALTRATDQRVGPCRAEEANVDSRSSINKDEGGLASEHRRSTPEESLTSPREKDADSEVKLEDVLSTTSAAPWSGLEVDAATTDSVEGSVSIEQASESNPEDRRRAKPAAWLVSVVTHGLILIVLAAMGLQARRPKDQVALSASISRDEEVLMESVEIQSSQPTSEQTEPQMSETDLDLKAIGEFAASEYAPDLTPGPLSPPLAATTPAVSAASTALANMSNSKAKTEFCGVEGGGNHFVYLVDSSGSMGDAFESARAKLLSSIQALKPDQRFYVVFFDAEPDYMRLRDPRSDEPRSVNATPKNKAALRRWAMRVSKDRGRAPYDPLRFALKLRPDVIFLLSDGEFPSGIEELLRNENRVANLFGESRPISIVHTIGYHSTEGETRMRRIAEQNQGQYRYVPKP